MPDSPVIAFGQQPCGFFPRRFLVAKVFTARRLQQEMGGEIVFFYHDADHDPRETQTQIRFPDEAEPRVLNFKFVNKTQRKYSPLAAKKIPSDWAENMARQLGSVLHAETLALFREVEADNVADFCLEMYRKMGMLEGIRIVRSSDPAVRKQACEIDDYFVDVAYEGETVRARRAEDCFKLHRGGNAFLDIPHCDFGPEQISPARDTRLRWMQSVLNCTHYIAGAGEQAYLNKSEAPGIPFVARDEIDRSHEAYLEFPI
ncbi:hypothetical protein N9Z12_01845 [Opitutaceae bacterium]|nr:hypothetical protein [Opitutaceae bacterium]